VLRPTRALVTVSVLLAIAVASDAFLVRVAFEYFKRAEAIRLDPAGLKTYAGERAGPPKDSPVLVFFGDSRALMWGSPTQLTSYRIVNRGVGFQTTAQILLRLDADVVQLHPSVVVLEAGINDLKTIAEFPERRREIVADCEANLAKIVEGCHRAGAEVVLVTVFEVGHVSLWRRPFWSSQVHEAVGEVNAYLRTMTGDRVVLFDVNPVLTEGRDEVEPQYQLDYLHLSSNGYEALNRKLAAVLLALPK
jgi:lysophospholipase L1-like esterase